MFIPIRDIPVQVYPYSGHSIMPFIDNPISLIDLIGISTGLVWHLDTVPFIFFKHFTHFLSPFFGIFFLSLMTTIPLFVNSKSSFSVP